MDNAWLIAPETRSRTNRLSRRHPHRLANLFERFVAFLSLEKELRPSTILTYRRAFADFLAFAEAQTKAPLLTTKFNTDLVRAYQYDLAERELRPTTVSLRLAVLASFSKWAVREGKLHRNPLDPIVRPEGDDDGRQVAQVRNPIALSRTPATYRRNPPRLGAESSRPGWPAGP